MFGISPIYNAIVVDLSHTDDIANEAFINGTLSFGPIILMNYLEYDDSLMLNSTIDLPTSRPRTKRHLDIRYLCGEGVAFLNHENQVELRCSAGVFAFSETTGDRFILTSGRCFPEDLKDLNTTFIYHVPWGQPEAFNFFGFSNFTSYSTTDFTIIERFDNEIDLTPQIRSSDNNFPSLFIEKFGNPIVGQHMCISGYVINIVCGRVTSLAVNPFLSAVRIHTITVKYLGLLRIETSGVTLHDIDRGGTVFSYIPSIGNQRVEVYGYVTHYYGRSRKSRKETVAVTTIHNLRTFGRFMNDLTFIDMGTYQPPL
ncbi:36486_t:CDS:1 [Gigaspora margarita]|uniref:36486_t:CDS:1 n=1 Tax=Gigaspora margarita TaxID=4874 RepID=A0ABN7V5N1_GIGMA|nr:36486_t:CDS:1 [Gigaspora margarita]